MKKNLISIIILALLIVNIVLTSIMMFSVMGSSKKTTALVNDIASVLNLELNPGNSEEAAQKIEVSIEDTAVYDIPEQLTIPCKLDADGTQHYYLTNVSLSMNTKDKAYKKYSETMADMNGLIESEIFQVFSEHTLDEILADTEGIKDEILGRLQTLFESEFIYRVSFSGTNYS